MVYACAWHNAPRRDVTADMGGSTSKNVELLRELELERHCTPAQAVNGVFAAELEHGKCRCGVELAGSDVTRKIEQRAMAHMGTPPSWYAATFHSPVYLDVDALDRGVNRNKMLLLMDYVGGPDGSADGGRIRFFWDVGTKLHALNKHYTALRRSARDSAPAPKLFDDVSLSSDARRSVCAMLASRAFAVRKGAAEAPSLCVFRRQFLILTVRHVEHAVLSALVDIVRIHSEAMPLRPHRIFLEPLAGIVVVHWKLPPARAVDATTPVEIPTK